MNKISDRIRKITTVGRKCMCLDSITKKLTSRTTLIERGWKQFDGQGATLAFQHQPLSGSKSVPVNTWIKAEERTIGDRSAYVSGFHIYSDEQQLPKSSNYRNVFYRNVHTVGVQDKKTIVVAAEMYVPSDPEAWPPRN